MSDINMSDNNMPVTDNDGVTPYEMSLEENDAIPAIVNNKFKETSQGNEANDFSDLPEVRRAKVDVKDRYLALHLPPLHTLEEIFNDLAAKAMSFGFGDVVKRLGDRPLRIATVCSGTESPILALEMFLQGLGADQRIRFSHVFSCEIVPFKQAYIERNFQPPILFRDILELGKDQARTAYGSLESVPGDLDILIAGTACVDFSSMNNKRKLLSEEGESSSTFNALLRYARKYRPRLIVMENVSKAPWENFIEIWAEIDYHAAHVILDSKNYYIPQTRTRGYLIAIDKHPLDGASIGGAEISLDELGSQFKDLMKKFARKASSPAGVFLLPENDRRLEQIHKDLSTRLEASSSRAEVNWDRYQIRHAEFRVQAEIGDQRPISRSQAGILGVQPPDFYWRSWFNAQVERVWETIDMKFLECITRGIDFNYKERWIDLSQGVDRGNESSGSSGVVGCLTPCGMPFMTSRGGPLSGLEALSLQGLPLDRIILTSESQRDLQDLAGNAMTSTAVCATMIAALILGYGLLEAGTASPNEAHALADEVSAQFAAVEEDGNILVPVDIEDSPKSFNPHDGLLQEGAGSAQYCICEGQSVVKDNLVECNLCGHRACSSCAGNPTHAYRSLVDPNFQRRSPLNFIAFLKGNLPMRLMLSGLSVTDFDELFACLPADHPPTPQIHQDPPMSAHDETERNLSAAVVGSEGSYASSPGGGNTTTAQIGADFARRDLVETVRSALAEDVRFYDIERSDIWTVIYEGEHSSMRLQIRPDGIQWLYFAKAPRSSPAQCLVREIFGKPIARMTPTSGTLLHGSWEIAAPLGTRISLKFSGLGEQVPAYQAVIGILKWPIPDMQVWSQVQVSGDDGDVDKLDADVRGVYTHLPECGTALASLYKKEATTNGRAVYLFLDPAKIGLPEQDSCVFSFEHSRLSGYSRRITIAELSHQFRATDVTETPKKINAFYRRWYRAPAAMTLQPFVAAPTVYRSLQPGYTVSVGGNHCHQSYTSLVSLEAPAKCLNLSHAPLPILAPATSSASWQAVALGKSSSEMRDVAWAVKKIASRTEFPEWNMINIGVERPSDDDTFCHTCDPPLPGIVWGRDKEGRVVPYEDPRGAAIYERAAKSKPAPFILFRRVDDAGNAHLLFALNIQSLAHQAYGRLVNRVNHSSIEFQWRLIGNTNDWGRTNHPRFTLLDNRKDDAYYQPPNFKLALRPEQLRSLTWMVSQEAETISLFVEEETEEALLPLMSWRAEVKVTMPRVVRGGVLCDEVGYGKTAIILGLIDTQYQQDCNRLLQSSQVPGQIAIRATLLVVPYNVFQQWAEEIKKFLAVRYKLLRIPNTKALSKISVKQMREADIILVPWSLYNSSTYYEIMRYFTGTPKVPQKPGRSFDSWFRDANKSLRQVVQVMQEAGPEGFLKDVWARRLELHRTQANSSYVPSRRLRGAAFVAVQAQARATTENGASEIDAPDQSSAFPCAFVSKTPHRAGSCPSPENSTAGPSLQKAENFNPLAGLPPEQAVAPDEDSSDESDNDLGLPTEEEEMKPDKPARKKVKGSRSSKPRNEKEETWDDRKAFNIPAPSGKRDASLENMTYLPLHAYSFNRVVVDEYTYTREERSLAILSLISRSKWILSGTPALDEFADVKDIARHLGIHLGIDNDGDIPTSNIRLKGARRNQTALEAFEMHQPSRSMSWYENRRTYAQTFLNRFARQNRVNTSKLPMETHLVVSDLLPREETIYQALYSRLVAEDGRVRKITGSDPDALSTTLNVFLTKSQSPIEALLRCATTAGMIDHPWNPDNCLKRILVRQKLSDGRWAKLTSLVRMAFLALNLAERSDKTWQTLVDDEDCETECNHVHFRHRVGDGEAVDSIQTLFRGIWERPELWSQGKEYDKLKENVEERFRRARPTKNQQTQLKKVYIDELAQSESSEDDTGSGKKKKKKVATKGNFTLLADDDEVYQENLQTWKSETVLEKGLVCEIFKTIEQIVECSREIRFFTVMHRLQTEKSYDCNRCLESFDSMGRDGLTVIRTCGHRLCQNCMALIKGPAEEEPVCVVDRCLAFACILKQVSGRSLEDACAGQQSSKLDSMVGIIKKIPAGEKALLFVQFEDAMTYASRALDAAGIQHSVAKSGRATAITDFVNQKAKSTPQRESHAPVEGGEPDLDHQENDSQRKRKRGSKLTKEEKISLPPKVLILQLGSVMAAGLNLQLANHILFLSPLLAPTQQDYTSNMTQAIGRCRRFGQQRTVHTYHLLTRRTADVNVLQERTGTVVVQRGTEILSVPPSEVQPYDERCEGNTLVFASTQMPSSIEDGS
ncbi:hypothetical protein F1880_008744 [Penicillium rolfsii]|nr:hypothetical protein F1880_008744 [Penicillium rolfsii]